MAVADQVPDLHDQEKTPSGLEGGPTQRTQQDDQAEPLDMSPARLWVLTIGVAVGLFLSFLDTSIIATSIFSIGAEFGEAERVNWVALSYSLAYLGCALLFARVSDVAGRRDAYAAAYAVFFAASIWCGFARSLGELVAARAVQGLGGSGLYSITMIILVEVTPARLRSLIGGLIGVVITVASVLGPVLGGVLTRYATWRWVFWINGPVGAVSMLLFFFSWPRPECLPRTERRSWRELDLLGSLLLIAATVLIVFPFQSAGSSAGQWGRAVFLAPLLTGLFCLAALLCWSAFVEKRWGDQLAAALPMRLLKRRVYAAAVINTMLLGFPYVLTVYAFPLRLQVVNGKDPVIAGVMLLPMLGSSAIGSVLGSIASGKKDRTCAALLAASCFMLLGSGLLSTLSSAPEVEAKSLGFLVFMGLGFGLAISTTTMTASLSSSIRDHAPAQGLVAQVRVFGGSIGIAASSAILGVTLADRVGSSASPDGLASLSSGMGGVSEAQLDLVREAYADAFNQDMRVCAIVAGAAVVAAMATFSRQRLSVKERQDLQIGEEKKRREEDARSKLNDTLK